MKKSFYYIYTYHKYSSIKNLSMIVNTVVKMRYVNRRNATILFFFDDYAVV